jgi:DNA-binding NarL/FixJ family response regulator
VRECEGAAQAERELTVIDLNEVKVTPRDQQVLNLLVQGCSNKDIAGQLNISPRTVKQHLRTLFLRAGIRDGRKRVKLAIAMFARDGENS